MKTRINTMSSGPCRQVLDCGSLLPLFAVSDLPQPPQSARGRLPLPTTPGADSVNPNGIPSSSPGLRGTSYPGKTRANPPTLKGLPQGSEPLVGWGCAPAATLSGLRTTGGDSTQGSLADSATAGLDDGIPLGLAERPPGLVGNGKRGLAHSKTLARDSQAAFTRIELVAVLLVLSLGAAVILPALASNRPRSQRVLCASNLRQIGQAFNLWGNDHGDRLPYNVALTDGGTLRHPLAVNPWLHFSWMSNELSSPAILLCPSDTGRPARDFSADPNGGYLHPNFANAATSYALSHGEDGAGRTIISFDRNMGNEGTLGCSAR